MNNSLPEMSEKLVQYLDGELSEVEKEKLELQLTGDIQLQDELNRLKSALYAVRLYGVHEKVSSIHSQMMKEMKPPVKSLSLTNRVIRKSLAIAAGIIILVGIFLAYNFFTLSTDKLFTSNFRSYELSTVRGNGIQEVSSLEELYISKEYRKVISTSFNRPFTHKESFLRAMSFVELNDNKNAIDEYRKVITGNETAKTNMLKDEAEYYLALTYIRNNELDAGIELLEKIKEDPNHLYSKNISRSFIRKVKMLRWLK